MLESFAGWLDSSVVGIVLESAMGSRSAARVFDSAAALPMDLDSVVGQLPVAEPVAVVVQAVAAVQAEAAGPIVEMIDQMGSNYHC